MNIEYRILASSSFLYSLCGTVQSIVNTFHGKGTTILSNFSHFSIKGESMGESIPASYQVLEGSGSDFKKERERKRERIVCP